MPTHVVLVDFTQKGVENIKDSPARLDAVKQAAQRMGGTLKEFYLTMGSHDMVIVAEAPNEETLAKVLLATQRKGASAPKPYGLSRRMNIARLLPNCRKRQTPKPSGSLLGRHGFTASRRDALLQEPMA
jgi:uncharacterized protein with GYD domain